MEGTSLHLPWYAQEQYCLPSICHLIVSFASRHKILDYHQAKPSFKSFFLDPLSSFCFLGLFWTYLKHHLASPMPKAPAFLICAQSHPFPLVRNLTAHTRLTTNNHIETQNSLKVKGFGCPIQTGLASPMSRVRSVIIDLRCHM